MTACLGIRNVTHWTDTRSIERISCYTNRIVLAWNSLSDTVVTALSVNAFGKKLNTVNLKKFLVAG